MNASECTELVLNCEALQKCWPIVVALAPTIIVGLTKYRSGGIVGAITAILDRLSFCTHADAKNTFKLPGKRSRPHGGQ